MNRVSFDVRSLALAGIAGGLAEVAWVGVYCAASPLSGDTVLRGITASLLPALEHAAYAPALGMIIHFTLAVAVALGFGLVLSRSYAAGRSATALCASAQFVLAAIWSVNFFVMLPALNPAFVALMPYAVTLLSKLLFGAAMAATLVCLSRPAFAAAPAAIRAA